jgi:hypothetical protein
MFIEFDLGKIILELARAINISLLAERKHLSFLVNPTAKRKSE